MRNIDWEVVLVRIRLIIKYCDTLEKFRSISFGKPRIRGHRIPVSHILDLLAGGETIEEILQEYPSIEREDVLACLAYGAEMSRDVFVEIPLNSEIQTEQEEQGEE